MDDGPETARSRTVSVVIPARNEAERIGDVVAAVLAQRPQGRDVEVVVVDDGSTDETAARAREAGARVLALSRPNGGSPAAARNRGARAASGDPIVFMDADCLPADGWLRALLEAHEAGAVCVGGSLALPSDLSLTARLDYYCGWYHFHPSRSQGEVDSHPPANLSVARREFEAGPGFTEEQPLAYAHEELALQAALREGGHRIDFRPEAVVYHYNRPGIGNLLRRNYRWGYSAIESKARSGGVRFRWLYRRPWLAVVLSAPLALASTVYVIASWARAGVWEPLLLWPGVLAARTAYACGMAVGGARWLRDRGGGGERRPRWE